MRVYLDPGLQCHVTHAPGRYYAGTFYAEVAQTAYDIDDLASENADVHPHGLCFSRG